MKKYTIINKNGPTPRVLRGEKTHDELMLEVRSFLAWNESTETESLSDDVSKIAYFNQHSFYVATEVA